MVVLTLKNLQQQTFTIEIELSATVSEGKGAGHVGEAEWRGNGLTLHYGGVLYVPGLRGGACLQGKDAKHTAGYR